MIMFLRKGLSADYARLALAGRRLRNKPAPVRSPSIQSPFDLVATFPDPCARLVWLNRWDEIQASRSTCRLLSLLRNYARYKPYRPDR